MGRVIRFDDRLMLLQAFDLLGAHLYGETWTGQEPWARPIEPPDLIRNRKRDLESRILEIEEEIAKSDRRFRITTDENEQAKISADAQPLRNRRDELSRQLMALPGNLDSYATTHEAYERRETVHNRLWQAAMNNEIRFFAGQGIIIEWRKWTMERGFRLYPNLSMIRAPMQIGNRRECVSVLRQEFENWCRLQTPVIPSISPLLGPIAPEKEAVSQIKKVLLERPELKTKGSIKEVVMGQIEGLSERGFERAWKEAAPDSMKRGGRRKGT